MDNPETNIKEDIDNRIRKRSVGRILIPIGLVSVGGVLLAHQFGMPLPDWIFSWQFLLIILGIFSGLAHAFRGPGWLIMILIGTFFLMDQLVPGLDIHRFIWPAVIILVGLIMLIRPKKPHWMEQDWHRKWEHRDWERWQRRRMRRGYPERGDYPGNTASTSTGTNAGSGTGMGYSSKGFSSEDFIDATTILGGIHKNILSKNFKGGDITIFMGGAEINLSQADIQGTASLDITQIMGGTKIIIPPHWEVRSQLTSVFGNIEDKRTNIGITDPNKVLIIDGSSVFGGIEIRNY
ncbi:MAG TPA: LiaF domain-containing protein [Puia sp.]|jgi:predicted membrane protein